MRLSQGFGGTGEKGHLFNGTGNQRPKSGGNKDQYWGTGNIRNKIFDFGGTWEQANLSPRPPGSA